jgi:hypothetical protein
MFSGVGGRLLIGGWILGGEALLGGGLGRRFEELAEHAARQVTSAEQLGEV